MLEAIPASRLPHEWQTIGPALAPAIATDNERVPADVFAELVSGEMQAWRFGNVLIVTTEGLSKSSGLKTLWVVYVAGERSERDDYRTGWNLLAYLAILRGCTAVQIEGPRAHKWARVIGGFEHVKGQGHDALYRRLL